MTEESLFHEALAKSPAERSAFLDKACANQPQLRASVEALLAAHDAPGSLMDPLSPGPDETMESGAGEPAQTLDSGTPDSPPDRTTAMRTPAGSEGTVIAGRYKLRQQIGEGGMGTVWMADQTSPVKRKVAVKLIRVERGQSKTILARFEAERQAIALMDHPHIARLLDAGTTDDGSPFFVMELVKGIPLNEFCDQHRLTVQERLTLFLQICSAVQHAHQKGIIHRDLKPSNVLVESHDGKPVPKVIDFGLAKATTGLQLTDQSMFTAFGSVMGTPLYMAPEQANFNAVDVDTRADVYALGIILYELLTGTTPITRDTLKKAALDEMLKLVREQEAPTPSSRLSSAESAPNAAASRQMEPLKLGRFLKGELDWIVMKALSKERDRRYETANGLARDIERFLNHEPVQAGPPSTSYRFRKFVRRNRSQVIAASLVLLALVGGVVGTTMGLFEARKQERLAVAAAGEERNARDREAERAEGERLARLEAQANEKLAGERLVQVEAEKKRADEEKQIAQAVKDFLQTKLLAQADTRAQADSLLKAGELAAEAKFNPTIRELLDRAAKELAPDKIEANFPRQPLVQAEILRTVAVAYLGVGEAATAIPFLTRSVELFKANLGPDHPDTLTSMSHLAYGNRDAGKLDLALPLFEETLKLRKAKLGPDHPDTLSSTNDLAYAYRVAGKLDLALPLFEETLKLQKAKLGPDHPDTLIGMSNLAGAYEDARKLDLAVPLFEETLKLAKAKLGPDHPHTLVYMCNLAGAYHAAGRLDLALPLNEEVVKQQKAELGPDHPTTLTSTNNLAYAYRVAGKLDLALPLFEETLKIQKTKLGPDHPDTLTSMNNLAGAYKAAGKLDLALPLFEETLRVQKAKLGLDHPRTLTSMNNLAWTYQSAGKRDLALPLFEETLKFRKAKLGPDHPDTLASMDSLALAYLVAGKLDQALPLYEETLKLAKAKLGPDHPATLVSMIGLALAYQAARKLDLALPLFEETLKLAKARLGPDHPDTLASMRALALAYKAAGKNELALPLHEETLKLRKAKLGPDHPDTLASMRALAIHYQASGHRTEELELLEDVLPRRRTALGPHHRDTLMSMHDLAWSYCRDGRYDIGLPLYEEALSMARTHLGESDAHTLALMRNFAQAYQTAGKLDLAVPLWEQACIANPKDTLLTIRVAALQAWFGQNERLKATGASALRFAKDTQDPLIAERSAKVCFLRPSDDKDQLNAAVTLARRAVDVGQKNPALPYFQMALGMAQYRSGSFGEAEKTLAPLLEAQKQNPHIFGTAGFFQAMTLFRQGRTEDATKRATITTQGMKPLPLDDRNPLADSAEPDDVVVWLAYKEAKQLIGFDATPDRSGQLAKHCAVLLQQKKWAEAEPLLRESLAIREKKEPDDWRTFNTQSMLGGSLLGQKKYAEAEPLLLKGCEGMKAREKTIPAQGIVRLSEALDRLIELYTATNKPDEVNKWQAERAKYPMPKKGATIPSEKK